MKKFILSVLIFCFTVFSPVFCFAHESFLDVNAKIFNNETSRYGYTKLNDEQIEYILKIGKPNNSEYKKKYITKIKDEIYYGLPNLSPDKPANDDIYVYRRHFYKDIKALKNYLNFKNKYNLNDATCQNIALDTEDFTKNIKLVKTALDENLYEKYCTYNQDRILSTRVSEFKKSYKITKKLAKASNLSEKEKQNAFAQRDNIVSINNRLYKNLYQVKPEILNSANKIEFFSSRKYKSPSELEKYRSFKKFHNLNDEIMNKVWQDTKRLRKNVKLVEKALQNGTYYNYYEYNTGEFKPYINTPFKENFNSYILLKGSSVFNDEQITKIITKNPCPAIVFNPKYWGKKDKKIKKVLNNKKIENKYSLIREKLEYRSATPYEILGDFALRAFFMFLILSIVAAPWSVIFLNSGAFLEFVF